MKFRVKKYFGQNFLQDLSIAELICRSLSQETENVLEIGPGFGVLTQFIVKKIKKIQICEIDIDLVNYLKYKFPDLCNKIIHCDILKLDLSSIFENEFSIIGNFPYNISSQILFKILYFYQYIFEIIGMFQKEVADRIVANHGNKVYGILSVLVQFYYKVEYLFTVSENVFYPRPNVKSAVIRLKKLHIPKIFNQKLAFLIVKTAFNQRRKILKNSLKSLIIPSNLYSYNFLDLRAEELSVDDFVKLINLWQIGKYEKIL